MYSNLSFVHIIASYNVLLKSTRFPPHAKSNYNTAKVMMVFSHHRKSISTTFQFKIFIRIYIKPLLY